MPLAQKWSHFDKDHVSNEPDSFGVYELGDSSGEIIYIGEGRLYNRLSSHFAGGRNPKPGAAKYRAEITGKERAEQRERAELRDYIRTHGDCPRFNDRLG